MRSLNFCTAALTCAVSVVPSSGNVVAFQEDFEVGGVYLCFVCLRASLLFFDGDLPGPSARLWHCVMWILLMEWKHRNINLWCRIFLCCHSLSKGNGRIRQDGCWRMTVNAEEWCWDHVQGGVVHWSQYLVGSPWQLKCWYSVFVPCMEDVWAIRQAHFFFGNVAARANHLVKIFPAVSGGLPGL